jgi:membrane-associated phospholipid phosphatase
MNLVETVGYQGPIISLVLTSVALLDQKEYCVPFILFYFIEYYTNGVLKQVFKQLRPSGFLDKNDGGNYTETEKYGMPSGHSSSVWYCFTYLWLVKPTHYLLIIDLAICLNTMYQRWAFKKHTIGQLAVGMLVGGSIAWLSVAVTRHVLKTNIK